METPVRDSVILSLFLGAHFNPLLSSPRSKSQFSPPATTYFLLNWLQEFGVGSRQQLLLDMFEYFNYLLAG